MTRAGWFHCFAGIAGDMALGSLIDAGADVDEVIGLLERLPLHGWSIEPLPVLRCGIAATQMNVKAAEDGVVRTYPNIVSIIEQAALPPRVRMRALATFDALAEVESRLHRRPPELVHFHEVGGLDAIVDIVGTAAALEVLDVDSVHASSVATGTGLIRTAHGMMPNPAPAVVELLRNAPTYGRDEPCELTTPTGAALLTALATSFGPLPAMRVEATGFGAGTRELDGLPNATQVVIGELVDEHDRTDGQPAELLELNVDDATGEVLSHALALTLDAGAYDAWITPVLMKKGRPGHVISVLTDPSLRELLSDVLCRETGSFGIRSTNYSRRPRTRNFDQVSLDGELLRVKVSPGRAKVEYDDAARMALRTKRPLREVMQRAEAAWLRKGDDTQANMPTDEGA